MYGHGSLEAYYAGTEYFCKETYPANSESLEGGEEAEFSGSKNGEVTVPSTIYPFMLFNFFFFFYHVLALSLKTKKNAKKKIQEIETSSLSRVRQRGRGRERELIGTQGVWKERGRQRGSHPGVWRD